MLLGYPIEIWIAVTLSVIVKIRYDKKLTALGAIVTFLVSIGSGMILYIPVMELFSLGAQWAVFIAMLIALTADNIMKSILEISEDSSILKDWATYFITRTPPKDRQKDQKKGENND